ncbi:diguanylate cyclase [Undibacterium cyanobacteriorum]|uniref:diguanylate cyclase n=1 Tax=Undibacterium cyanobacteriorum TaxID=3073561 RepID=A0ABY9RPN9_9BURK|nr:diguanylate cyclase [Undibacterium sp. 20NA77.5]WMW81956.1 diguanylate cyclase [Undibacterium sp. 20NA77.5]
MSAYYPEAGQNEYQHHYQLQDHALGRRVLRFMMWVSLPLLYVDAAVMGLQHLTQIFDPKWLALAGLRLAVCAYAWWILQGTGKRSEGNLFQRHLYAWAILSLLTQVASNYLSPTTYLAHFLIDAWLLLMMNLVLPLRVALIRQLVYAYFFACLAIAFAKQFPAVVYQFMVVAILIVSAYSGQTIARHLHHYRLKLLSAELELQRRETTDPLTGIANRREFLRVSENELQRHARLGKTLSLLVIDLNHLQQINLNHGANVGDMVLTEVSSRIKRATRGYDCVARYGTEEFCVLLPEAGEEVAARIAERTQRTIEAIPVAAAGKELKVSAAVGFATMQAGENIEQMLRRAEAGLIDIVRHEDEAQLQTSPVFA